VSNIVQNDSTRQAFEPLVHVPSRQKQARFMSITARTRIPSFATSCPKWPGPGLNASRPCQPGVGKSDSKTVDDSAGHWE
jgi:hypothetical protein